MGGGVGDEGRKVDGEDVEASEDSGSGTREENHGVW
jgi:hypothetical protein